ncbi:hypothetical protein ABEV38_15670 [Parageobacillus thermoglucosidasius]|jgi:hypothetical protein|uniref:SnoaL-like domain-containing protein n=1 Tax=Geobacillus stearothermophilus TaxID=1422 RepID=B1GSL4_GEOSE|nr:hypothetical protein [Geobacillus stearothermophilus]KZM56307.1 hypothetical protein A3Q36_06095 [Geobacillus stearothermophilus]CAM58068.1 hypothetical protein D-ORF5 [Geobacillus stearothermophilus]CAP08252.1 hypothetical protein pGS18_ORF41 [Geobacillus stearothermophilus]
MRITVTNLVLVALLLIAGSFSFLLYTNLQEAKATIEKYQDIEKLNQRSEDFIRALIYGKHKKYLTGEQLEKYETGEKEYGTPTEKNMAEVNEMKIQQLFTKKIKNKDNEAESYAIVQVRYETGDPNKYGDDYIHTLTVNSHWVKDAGEWKVDHLEMSLLKDSRDEMLRKQAEEALRKAGQAS